MDVFLSTIFIWPPNFAPLGWALCAGQLLSINQNTALFSLLGTTYGGDGVTTFGLPDLRSRVPVGAGQGTGLSPYSLGQTGGTENVSLNINTLASHTHQATGLSATVPAVTTGGTTNQPSPSVVLAAPTDAARNPLNIYSGAAANQSLGPGTVTGSVAPAGGGQPHPNLQPYQALNYIIALQGIYPSRG
jgi:microcystin-dependent protein